MSGSLYRLIQAAKQLIDTDRALAGDVLAPGTPLPELPPRPAAVSAVGQREAPQAASAARPPPRASAVRPGGAGAFSRQPARAGAGFAGGRVSIPPVDPSRWAGDPEAARREMELQRIAGEIGRCTACGLCRGRMRTVPGEGHPAADILFIGEGPGEEEDRQGRPFVGRAGELLTRMIVAMGLSRSDVFIANVVKCRPPGNRAPQADEAAACADYLRRQMLTIHPKVIVAMGNPAVRALLGVSEGITHLRGRWQRLPTLEPELEGIRVMPTFHPAYVLRAYTADNRRKSWEDIQEVMKEVGLTPPKDRGKG